MCQLLNHDLEICQDANQCSKCFYSHVEKQVDCLKLPNEKWMYVLNSSNNILFLRIEKDFSNCLGVALDVEFKFKIYYERELIDWVECEKPRTKNDIEKNLQMLNDGFIWKELYDSSVV